MLMDLATENTENTENTEKERIAWEAPQGWFVGTRGRINHQHGSALWL